ncbi:E3 ubiquitin protein ligase TOM1 [Scheffersomyces xylosifermentans]|uniref:E3 ubiquitin protein ligase TOM1 n=1 Tax=Scheffersomyces xylosifermentans TaxID=1304137 RepID=UPI00315CE430
MIIEKRDHIERMEMARPMRALIDELTTCNLDQLAQKLNANLTWEKPRGDLLHWVPVLNRIDEVLEEKIKKYSLDQEYPGLQLFSPEDEELVCACLKFTFTLLDHCSDRSIYSSKERIFALINTPTIEVRLNALHVAVLISEKYCQSNSERYGAHKSVKSKVLQIARAYPPDVPPNYSKHQQDEANKNKSKSLDEDKPSVIGDHFSLLDTLNTKKKYPSKWRSIDFPYYKKDGPPSSQPAIGQKSKSKDSSGTNKKSKGVQSEGLSSIVFNEDSVRKLSLQQIFDKASAIVPKESWFDFGLAAPIAKSFNAKTSAAMDLRKKLLQIKCLAVGFICCISFNQSSSSRLFESKPYTFSFLVDLVSPENESIVSREVYFCAIKALECISLKKVWGSDIIRCMGGNVNHGVLFQCIRHINKKVVEEDPEYFEKGYIHFFNMVGNLINTKSLTPRLTSGGILNDLMSFFNLRTKYRWSCSAAIHLSSIYLEAAPDSFEEFVDKDGFNLLINTIQYEVSFALENPEYGGGAPADALVHYSITFRQANYIKNLLKLVSDLIQSDSGDRLRNLFDSPLLESFNLILVHPQVFGPMILATTIDCVFYIIHNEPTAFSILNEGKVVDTILDNYESFFLPSGNLLVSLPEVIGAICLNNEGLRKVKEKDTIGVFFKLFLNLSCSKELVRSDMATNLGCSFDELGRHYPVLKPVILEATMKLITEITPYVNERIKGVRFYTSAEHGSLYGSKNDDIIENEVGCTEIENWDSSDVAYLLDNVYFFLGGLLQDSGQWGTDSMKMIPFKLWMDFLTMPNVPFDYITSNGVSALMGILKYFDDEGRDYGFPEIFARLEQQFQRPEIQEFLNYDDPYVSFYLRFTDGNEEEGTRFLQQLNLLITLLYTMTEIYINSTSLSPERIQQIISVYEGDGLKTVGYIGQLLKRTIMEETIIRTNLPKTVSDQTLPAFDVSDNHPPLVIYATEPLATKQQKQDFTSAKFKNTLQFRFFNYNLQNYTSSLFSSLGRLCSSRKPEFTLLSWRREAVALTIEVGKVLTQAFDVKIDDEYYWECYILSMANVVLYALSSKDRTRDLFYTSLAISLFQHGFFESLKNATLQLWNRLLKYDPDALQLSSPKSESYITIAEGSILKNALIHLVTILAKGVNSDTFTNIPSAKLYFHTGYGKDTDNKVTSALLVQIRLVAMDMLHEMVGPQSLLNDSTPNSIHPGNVPGPIIEQVVATARHSYLGKKEGLDAEFVPFDVTNVSPPVEQVAYLVSLGMAKSEAEHFFRHSSDIKDIGNRKWPECPQFDVSSEQWEKYGELIRNDDIDFEIGFPTYRKSSELRAFRQTKNLLVREWSTVARYFPKSVDAVAELFISNFVEPREVTKVFEDIEELVRKHDKGQNLAVSIHLLQVLLKNDRWSKVSGPVFTRFTEFIDNELNAFDSRIVDEEYLTYALAILDQILVFRDIPIPEETTHEKIQFDDLKLPYIIPEDRRKSIFDGLLCLKGITNADTAVAVVRILVLYAREPKFVHRIIKSDLLKELVLLPITLSHKSPEQKIVNSAGSIEMLKTPLVILLRRCFETSDVFETYLAEDLSRSFGTTVKKTKDLKPILRDTAAYILRDPDLYVDYVSKNIRLAGYEGNDSFFGDKIPVLRLRNADEGEKQETSATEDVEMTDADVVETTKAIQDPVKQTRITGIMTLLLKYLMEATKNEWCKEDDKADEDLRHNFNYICFLLQTIAELLSSYKNSKLEFLAFTRKSNQKGKVKPRSTALNFFIHQLIPTHSLEKGTTNISSDLSTDPSSSSTSTNSGTETARRGVVAALAKLAITSLISTPLLPKKVTIDAKNEDSDMSFIRHYFVDVLQRIFKDTMASQASTAERYGKLADLFDLCGSVISSKFRDEGGLKLDPEATKWDVYHINRILLEKQIPAQITGIVAELDLNYPQIDKVVKASLKALSAIAKAKVENQDAFASESKGPTDGDDDDIVPEDVDDREETPDLFRNSTLGMYDVDFDTEDELAEEDNLEYFDDDGRSLGELTGESGSDDESNVSDSSASSGLSDLGIEVEEESVDDGYEDFGQSDIELDLEDSGVYEGDGYDSHHTGSIDDIEIIDELDIGSHSDMEGASASDSNIEGDDEDSEDEFYGFDDDGEVSEYDSEELDGWIEAFEDGDEDSVNEEELEDLIGRSRHNTSNRGNLRNRRQHNNFNNSANDMDTSDNDTESEILHGISRFPQIESASPALAVLLESFFRDGRGAIEINGTSHEFNGNQIPTFSNLFENILNLQHRGSTSADGGSNNIQIKSARDRWNDTLKLFYPNKNKEDIIFRVIPAIVNRIEDESIILQKQHKEATEKKRKEKEEKKRKAEEEERARKEEEARERELNAVNTIPLEPVMVRIGDREVDISGTDIDPEFFEALPDDMREEVFTQHVRERRANATSTGTDAREIDQDFLDALPEQIREEILQQEELARDYVIHERGGRGNGDGTAERWYDDTGFYPRHDGNSFPSNQSSAGNILGKSKSKKVFFTPLVDRQGVSALVRLLFAPLSIHQREHVYHTLQYVCYSKQTRVEVMSMLIAVVHEGLTNQRSIERIYSQICSRASGQKDNQKFKDKEQNQKETKKTHTLPVGSTTLSIGIQIIEAIDYLLERNTHLRYYILTEHENPFISKKYSQKKKTKDSVKDARYSINFLLRLLENGLVKDDQTFMDILARVLQISTRPLHVLLKVSGDGDKKPPFSTPIIPENNFRQIIKILTANECSNTTFRRTISAMQNLSILPNAQKVFSLELSEQAAALGKSIITDLSVLTKELSNVVSYNTESKSFSKFSAASSDQAKLLRILTALDYMFERTEKEKKESHGSGLNTLESESSNIDNGNEIEELTTLYNKLALGSLWDALSDCLRVLEEKKNLTNVATALLPLIEALMVVCKHSRVKELQIKDVIKYEARRVDFTKEPIERLFFSFTDEHKKILNQMVRTNPNLMSGPFGMLVRNPRVLEFDNKKNYFDRKLHHEKTENSKLSINIRREQVFLDSYRSLFFKSRDEFRDSKLEINFKGEAGVDAGGVTREWYQVLSRQMFNPDYALFTPVASDDTTFHPNRTSYINPEHLSFFKFIGRIIGKAIYDNSYLDCHFSRAVYKRLLGRPVSLKDMETLDLEYFKSLMWMLENDITDVITEDFSVETDDYGEHKIIDLVPNGRNIPVTEENKHDYVKKVVEYRLQTSVAEQMDNFLIGFHEIIPKELVAIFDEQELELLISGLPDISVQDWQNNSVYNNYSPSSLQIQWFWRAVKSFDNEERAKLLQFATGTSKVPLNGFKELSGANGTCKFSIHRDYGSTDRLPSSHTCFNQIDLPAYETYETLRGSLLLAITEGHEGFGLA